MLRIVSFAAVAGVTFVIATAAQAAPKTLAECYDIVIAAWNKTAHPESCASSGMDDCDEIFPVPLVNPGTPPRLRGLTIGH